MHLFLIRHGESYVNLKDWDGGFVDTALTDLGKQQAEALAAWLHERLAVDVLFSSTMARARETASYITRTTGQLAVPDDRLREFGNCYADGRPVELDNGNAIVYPSDWWGTERPNSRITPDGESWMLFRVRVSSFLSDMVARFGSSEPQVNVAVVCHGGVIEAAFDHVFNTGENRRVEIWVHNTGITHLEYCAHSDREVWRLHAHNLVAHLAAEDGWLGGAPVFQHAAQQR